MDEDVKNNVKTSRSSLGFRHVQIFLLFLGMVFISVIKVDMSLAILAMTDSTQNDTFDWTHQRQSVILSSYKWGYLFSKIPGGELSSMFGGKVVMVACGIVNGVFSVLLPIAGFYGDWEAVCACRLMQGLSSGMLFPAIHTLTGKWVPVEERARLSSAMFCGGILGTGLEYIVAGMIADSWGWEAIFYVNGTVLGVWSMFYIFLGSASPADCKMISVKERLYIQESLGHVNKRKRVKTPWKALLTSVPFLVLIVAQVGQGWGHWTILTEMPTYLNKVLGLNIKSNGVLSALPHFAGCLFGLMFGCISDYLLKKGWLSVTVCRKMFNSIASYGPAALLIGVSYVRSDVTVAIVLLTLCSSLNSAMYSGFNLVHLDMAPNHAGTMMGITGFVSNTISAFAPLTAGYLIFDESLPSEWRKVFFLSAALYVVTNTIFVIFGTSEKQPWNDIEVSETESSNLKEQHA